MKKRFGLLILILIFLILLSYPACAQTWKELFDRADSLFDVAKYDSAITIFRIALEEAETKYGKKDSSVAPILHRMAICYHNQGKYAEAESLYRQALNIRENTLRQNHPDVAKSLSYLGFLYNDQGRYAEAEPIHKQALYILEKALGPNHPDVAIALNNLANLYYMQRRFTEAEPLYKRALSIGEKTSGPTSLRVAKQLFNLGILYKDQRKYDQAEDFLRRALEASEKVLGPEHPDLGHSLNSLGKLYTILGRYTEAEPLFKRALNIREKALGSKHPEVAYTLNNLANLYSRQRKYSEAESMYKQALSIYEQALGFYHPYTAEVYRDMARMYRDKKDFANAKEAASNAYAIRRQNFKLGSAVLSEKDALTYSGIMKEEAYIYISILLDSGNKSVDCLSKIADIVFSVKGQVSDGIYARHRTRVYEKDPELKVISDSLRDVRFELANLYIEGPDEKGLEEHKKKLSEITKEKERLEADLARGSAEFRGELEMWDIDLDKVAGNLPPNSALIEYLEYDHLETGGEIEPHYLVILTDNDGKLFISDLGLSERIDSLVSVYRQHFGRISKTTGVPLEKDLIEYKGIAESLYKYIWKPVEDKLNNTNLIFIAPDAELNLISFAGLIDRNGKYLIESYPIHYLSSGRDLLRLKDKVKLGTGLLALGDPDFDCSLSKRASSVNTSLNQLRTLRLSSEELNKIKVLPLPATKKEIERISSIWKQKTKEPALVFLGKSATEENFKKYAQGKKVIHLATHGYYLESQYEYENPLLLSGLLLAGANLHKEGIDTLKVEDGILTAEEVTAMELEGARWVILSACESGLGEVKSGEGVYGLRRAFQMAGAKTIISALWSVSDKSTAEMMSYLYDYKERNLPLALQALSQDKLKNLRRRNQPDHPYLWGPFIAVGGWR